MGKSNLNDERTEHPSFAVININRVQIGGGSLRLFDSPFKHYNAITLEISPAALIRNLHGDTIMPTGEVAHIRVMMSEIQFANLVLNANVHGGTPCTVDSIAGKQLPQPPKSDLKKLWASEVKRDFKDVAEAAEKAEKDVDALLAKDRVTKTDLKALKDVIFGMAQDIRENLPWMEEQFEKTMEKVVATAKGEIDAHVANTVKKVGLDTIKAQAPALGFDGDPAEPPKKA